MTTTTTPQDLLAAITRAIAEGASADDRRAGRHACIVLASALGEPGAPMTPPTGPRPRIDAGQFLDLAIAKMRAFLDEQAAPASASPAAPAPDPTGSTATPASDRAATTTPTSRSRPAPALRIPLVGGFAPKR